MAQIVIWRPERLQKLLRLTVKKYFSSTLAAAKYAEIPQPTLWRVINGQRSASFGTLRGVRKLLRRLSDAQWESLLLSREDWKRLREYERAIRAEIGAYSTGYGLVPEGMSGVISEETQSLTEDFWRWGEAKGHHPERLRLSVWRISSPLSLHRLSDGVEPGVPDLTEKEVVAIVKAGIRREKTLLARVPGPLIQRGAALSTAGHSRGQRPGRDRKGGLRIRPTRRR